MLTWTLTNLLPDFSDALKFVHAFLTSPVYYHIIQIRLTNTREINNVYDYYTKDFLWNHTWLFSCIGMISLFPRSAR